MTNDERPQGVTDFEEAAWCLIANASGGDWTRESDEWRAAAARWREQYHAKLSAALQPAAAAQGDAEPVWWALTSKYGTRFYSTESQMRDEAQPEEVIVPLYAAPPSAPAAQGHDARDAARYRYWRGAMVAICAEAPFDNFDLADALSEAETSDDYDRAIDAALALSPPQIDGEAK